MQKITPFLWFNTQAEEAMNYYCSIFKNSKPIRIIRYGKQGPGPIGMVMTANFILGGQEFVALNGGPAFTFSQAISFVVNCKTQEEIDRLWDLLSQGGEQQACGWLKDKFGVSWQIVPVILAEMLGDPDPEKSGRVMKAMLPMGKLDIKILEHAYTGT
jgi:predicted 3-demethylubiquinone-9 3-methyltransferase (glyoxalase superfamily)